MAPRRQFYAPNARTSVLDRWRTEGRIRAIGALTCHGGLMRGSHLAAVVGVSPRGLRTLLVKDDLISVEIRQGPNGHGETWYRLNLAALPPVPEPPPIRLEGAGSETRRRLRLHVRADVIPLVPVHEENAVAGRDGEEVKRAPCAFVGR